MTSLKAINTKIRFNVISNSSKFNLEVFSPEGKKRAFSESSRKSKKSIKLEHSSLQAALTVADGDKNQPAFKQPKSLVGGTLLDYQVNHHIELFSKYS